MIKGWGSIVLVLAAVSPPARAQVRPTTPDPTIERVAWIAGCWQARQQGRVYDEQWMAPRGGTMPGMSRTVRGDDLVGRETLRIFERGGHLVYFAHPSGQAPTEFASVAIAGDSVAFENAAHDFPHRIVYRRAPGDSLHAYVEGEVPGGAVRRIGFRMARAECPDAPAAGALRDEVLAQLERYYADFSARDWNAFADHFWPGATLTTVWQPPGEPAPRVAVTTVPEFVAQAPQGPGSRLIFEERMLSARVRITGNLAQAWARYHARFGDPGAIMEWTGTDAFTLLKHDGRWRIVSLAYASDDPP